MISYANIKIINTNDKNIQWEIEFQITQIFKKQK